MILVRVLAVNNYATRDRFERLASALQSAGGSVSELDWSRASASRFNEFDGVVLSGSYDMLSEGRIQSKFRGEMEAIIDSSVPMLGVCFGHQMMGSAFGSRVVKDGRPVLRYVNTSILSPVGLFRGLPRKLSLLESRHEIVESLPTGFELIAKSETSAIAAMKHLNRPLYGVQSHPERYSQGNPDGSLVLANFLRLLR